MAKSKKNRQKDFQKVKFKVGKKLPKGDNVTNLSFKTRQIKLTQRIKEDDGQKPVTKNKLGIQDLLRQCDHHSSSARVNAVCGLKELWLNNTSDLLIPTNVNGYGVILKKLSTLLIDNEAVVRHTVINLFKLILNRLAVKSTEDNMNRLAGNLFTHIHAFLCCAMNHVHEDIKLDALLLFDTLLDTFPLLMVQQTGDLMKNLIGLISTPVYLGTKGNATTQRLSLNPDSKLPAMKFRARVLQRMKKAFMEALNDDTRKRCFITNNLENSQDTWSSFPVSQARHDTCFASQDTGIKFSVLFSGGCHDLDDYITKPSSLESFIKLSVPVLLQCWKEARASVDEHSSSDNLVPADCLEVMSLVMCIIQLMFVLCSTSQRNNSVLQVADVPIVSPELLVKNYLQDFVKLFMNNFPYSVQVLPQTIKKRKKNKDSQSVDSNINQSTLLALNLAVCDVMSSFCSDLTLKPGQTWIKKLQGYVIQFFQRSPSVEQSKTLIRVMKNIFINPHIYADFTKAYKFTLKHYMTCKKMVQKRMFFNLFAFMGQTWDGWERNDHGPQPHYRYECNGEITAILEEFFQSLPGLLLDVKNSGEDKLWLMEILTLMCCGCTQRSSKTFKAALHSKLTEILDSQTGIFCYEDEQIQQRLCFLLSLGAPLSREQLKQLLHLLRHPRDKPVILRRKSWSIVAHLIHGVISNIKEQVPLNNQVIFNKMSQDQHSQLSDYLRFMFSLQIGMIAEEMDGFTPPESDLSETTRWLSFEFSVQGDQWERHVEIANIVAKELANFHIPASLSNGYHQVFTFTSNMEQLWKSTLANRPHIHILSAYSLIKYLYETSFPHITVKPSTEFYQEGSLVIASVLSSLFCRDVAHKMPSEEMVWLIKADIIECLTMNSSLLELVLKLLTARSLGEYKTSEDEKQASKTAIDFLYSNDSIKSKILDMKNMQA
ncbi:unnamed protein product [Lymnaea stagnalis]|uniref:Pre-rRNA-processing protein Ipi1 N-terminal domain-containing protein n=1 Tax=Lymnaea stagnalis TaxID=6523 RepID=A0AAV2GX33_LYMST